MSDSTSSQRTDPLSPAPPRRIASVDALRGFDMFWLVGGTGLALGIVKLCSPGIQDVLLPQLDHREWEGCTFYDLIFPLFVFVVGMAVVFSLDKFKANGDLGGAYRRIFRRFVLMFVLGVLYYGGMQSAWPDIRLLGVLQRIALCYLFAGVLYLHFRPKVLAGLCAGILVGYWALFTFVPVPGLGETSFAESANWARYIDEQFLPGAKHEGTWDANGLLGTLPSVATCLLGVLAALFLRDESMPEQRKALLLIGGGIALALLGWAWGLQFPVIKKIWTSSYVLVTGGYSLALLGCFHQVMDVWRLEKWAVPLLWIGANPLTIYLARNIADFNALAERFTGGSVANAVGPDWAYLFKTTVSLALSLALVRYLYQKKIFIRI